MPVPSTFDDLSETASSNSPAGSETVGTQANEYLQAAFSFIRQIYDGVLKPLAAVDFNAQTVSNIANGDTSSSSTDALTGAQVRALAYKVGEQRMWHGAVADIESVWGSGWQLADGTNGTADCRNRFIVGAGDTYSPGDTGGAASTILTVDQLPTHNHPTTDNGHIHPITDNGHIHTDSGHVHPQNGFTLYNTGNVTVVGAPSGTLSFAANTFSLNTGSGVANIQKSTSGIAIQPHTTGITVNNTGSGASIDNRPPYYASCILEYTGIGA